MACNLFILCLPSWHITRSLLVQCQRLRVRLGMDPRVPITYMDDVCMQHPRVPITYMDDVCMQQSLVRGPVKSQQWLLLGNECFFPQELPRMV